MSDSAPGPPARSGPITTFLDAVLSTAAVFHERWRDRPPGQRPDVQHPDAPPRDAAMLWRPDPVVESLRPLYRMALSVVGRPNMRSGDRDKLELLWDDVERFFRGAPWALGYGMGGCAVSNVEADPEASPETKWRAKEVNADRRRDWEARYQRIVGACDGLLDLAAFAGETAGTVPREGGSPETVAAIPDGPEAGCRVWFKGKSVSVKGRTYAVIAFMWNRTSASFDAIKDAVKPKETVSDETINTWAHRANTALHPLPLAWKLTADGVNRVVRQESR